MMPCITDVLATCKELQTGEAVNDAEIKRNEDRLGLQFSPEYKDYLRAFGVVSFYGHEFTGVCSSPRLNVADATEEARDLYDIEPNMYLIEDTGYEGILILQNQKGEIFQVEPNSKPQLIATSLVDYIRQRQC